MVEDGAVGVGDGRGGRKVEGCADDGKGPSISSPAKIQSGKQANGVVVRVVRGVKAVVVSW